MAQGKATRPVTRPRPSSFTSSSVRCDFSIAAKKYRFESVRSGFEVRSGRERWQVRFEHRACAIDLRDGEQRLTMRIDAAKAPNIAIAVRSLGKSWSASGSVEAVTRSLVEANIQGPNAVAIRLLLAQMRLSPEFNRQMSALGASAVLIANYQPFLNVVGGDMCVVACALCAAQMILTPGPTPDDLPACVACGVCRYMGWI